MPVPVAVVRRHRAGDVQVLPILTHMEREAADANRPPHPRRDVLGVELALEQVPPQVPMRVHPQVALADGNEDHRLRDGVGGEIVQLHPIVVAERTDEVVGGDTAAPLV